MCNCCMCNYFRKRCYFMIKSKMNNKVLDIKDCDESPGAEVIMWEQSEADNQLWYEDRHGNIYSKLNGLTLECSKFITIYWTSNDVVFKKY